MTLKFFGKYSGGDFFKAIDPFFEGRRESPAFFVENSDGLNAEYEFSELSRIVPDFFAIPAWGRSSRFYRRLSALKLGEDVTG